MIIASDFHPATHAANRHIQTLLPTVLRSNHAIHCEYQPFTLPDGDFLDLAWNKLPSRTEPEPIVVIFHGLEGSINSPYAKGLMHVFEKLGWHESKIIARFWIIGALLALFGLAALKLR